MKLINVRKLDKFTKKHKTAKRYIDAWKSYVEKANWTCFEDIWQDNVKFRPINNIRIVFNVGGNKWRIDVVMNYILRKAIIIRIGTHEEYNKWRYND